MIIYFGFWNILSWYETNLIIIFQTNSPFALWILETSESSYLIHVGSWTYMS